MVGNRGREGRHMSLKGMGASKIKTRNKMLNMEAEAKRFFKKSVTKQKHKSLCTY